MNRPYSEATAVHALPLIWLGGIEDLAADLCQRSVPFDAVRLAEGDSPKASDLDSVEETTQ